VELSKAPHFPNLPKNNPTLLNVYNKKYNDLLSLSTVIPNQGFSQDFPI
jgi:hypothetical protein